MSVVYVGLQEVDYNRRRRLDNFTEIMRLKQCVDDVENAIQSKSDSIQSSLRDREAAKVAIEDVRQTTGSCVVEFGFPAADV